MRRIFSLQRICKVLVPLASGATDENEVIPSKTLRSLEPLVEDDPGLFPDADGDDDEDDDPEIRALSWLPR